MNQILFANENGQKKSMTVDINKIIKFFCIFVIILGLGITTMGAYSFITINSASMEDDKLFPEIDIQKKENHIYITITHGNGIESVKYQWNDAQEHTINGSGRTQISEILELPAGTNILNLTVRDVTGQEIKDKREFISESEIGPDVELPEINISPDGKEVRIVATDETEISYLTYQWNDEEPTRVDLDSTSTDRTQIRASVEVLRGQNTLTITAVDNDGNTTTQTETIKGANRPTFTVTAEGTNLVINAQDEEGISKIAITVDGVTTDTGDAPLNQKEIRATQEITPGTHTVTITVTNISGLAEEQSFTVTL